jgi:hypothetical protein
MRKPVYKFEAFDNSGKMLRRCTRSCDSVGAHEFAEGILSSTPEAAAVFGFEERGRQVQSVYRR